MKNSDTVEKGVVIAQKLTSPIPWYPRYSKVTVVTISSGIR